MKKKRKLKEERKRCSKCDSIWVYVNKNGTIVCRKCGHRSEKGATK